MAFIKLYLFISNNFLLITFNIKNKIYLILNFYKKNFKIFSNSLKLIFHELLDIWIININIIIIILIALL